ncbi:MAG: prepilin-type N-terminal cleavage/methylation domain-containing protein [Verrucomicrobiota bacterium]
MNPYKNPRNRFRSPLGFTLVELLVTITIIVVLVLVAVIAIGKARARAELANCATNLRAWGVAVQGYSQDHNGDVQVENWGAITDETLFYEEYLGGDKETPSASHKGNTVYRTQICRCCPSQKWTDSAGPVGYAMIRPNSGADDPDADPVSYRLNAAEDPSRLLLMIESNGETILDSPEQFSSEVVPLCTEANMRHSESVNALFADGHVSVMKKGDLEGTGDDAKRQQWFTLR